VNDVMRFSYNMFTCIQGQKTLKCSHIYIAESPHSTVSEMVIS